MRNLTCCVVLAVVLSLLTGCATALNYRHLNGTEAEGRRYCEIKQKFFTPDANASVLEHKARNYYFCCASCVEVFKSKENRLLRIKNTDNTVDRTGAVKNMRETGEPGGANAGSCH